MCAYNKIHSIPWRVTHIWMVNTFHDRQTHHQMNITTCTVQSQFVILFLGGVETSLKTKGQNKAVVNC